jgi:malonate transporter and related proteins
MSQVSGEDLYKGDIEVITMGRHLRAGRHNTRPATPAERQMLHILSITAPIYLLIGLGWLVVRHGLFDPTDLRVMGRFVLQIALPALLFRALATRPIAEVLNPGYLGAVALGSVGVFAATFALSRQLRGKSAPEAAIHGTGASFANSAYIGYPIALLLVGPVAGVALALNMLVENLVMLPLLFALAESGQGQGGWAAVRSSLAGLARNPMILAILAGFAAALLQLPMPAPLLRSVDLLANAVAAVGLVVIGGSLVGLSTQGLVRDISFVAIAKLLIHPLAVWAALWLMPPVEPALRTAAVTMAAMPMLGIYPILAQKYGLEGPAAAVMLGTTLASFISITAVLSLLTTGTLPWP